MRSVTLTTLLALLAMPLRAQDCTALLEHGLRNIQRSHSTEAAVATKYFNHCFKDVKSLTDNQLAEVEVQVFGFGAGGGGYTRTQRENRLTEWCKTSAETAIANKNQWEESQTIYSDAVAAWQNCNKLKSDAVSIEPKISPDSKKVDISIKYTGPAPHGPQFLGAEPEGFSCSTKIPGPNGVEVFDAAKTTYTTNQAIKVSCTRTGPLEKTKAGTTFSYVPRGVITVSTAGDDLQLFFPEEWDPGLPIKLADELRAAIKTQELPRGTILAWYTKTGPVPLGWLICDGNNGTPNLKDRFLRGTTDVTAVGTPGGAATHTHTVTVTLPDSGRKGSDWHWGDTPWKDGPNPVAAGKHNDPTDEQSNLPPFVQVVYIIKQ